MGEGLQRLNLEFVEEGVSKVELAERSLLLFKNDLPYVHDFLPMLIPERPEITECAASKEQIGEESIELASLALQP